MSEVKLKEEVNGFTFQLDITGTRVVVTGENMINHAIQITALGGTKAGGGKVAVFPIQRINEVKEYFSNYGKETRLPHEHRKHLKRFVRKHISEHDLDRTDDSEEWNFSNQTLYQENDKQIDALSKYDLRTVYGLFELIKKGKVANMDKESMACMSTSGFCWNAEGQFVIFNER